MKRILITGVTGFLGTNLVHFFHDDPNISLFGHSREIQKAKAKFVGKDLDIVESLDAKNFNENNIDIVIHLAGIAHDISGKYSMSDYQLVNYEFTKQVYDEFVRSEAGVFVFVSSIKAVVDHTDCLVDEDFEPAPSTYYGISKMQAEQYIRYKSGEGKKNYILRPCMIHGPGNKGNLNLLFRFVRSGVPYPLAAFKNKRSFLSIENFCFVIKRIVEDRLQPSIYHLADGQPVSTIDLVKTIGEETGRRARLLKIPKGIIWTLARMGSLIHAPFNTKTVSKLCENLMVSNEKLLLQLKEELPVRSIDGLRKTIRSLDD